LCESEREGVATFPGQPVRDKSKHRFGHLVVVR
jgi:hypothetical protein